MASPQRFFLGGTGQSSMQICHGYASPLRKGLNLGTIAERRSSGRTWILGAARARKAACPQHGHRRREQSRRSMAAWYRNQFERGETSILYSAGDLETQNQARGDSLQ